MSSQRKEPLLRIAKRDGIARPKAYAIRIVAVLLSLVVSGLFIFSVTDKCNLISGFDTCTQDAEHTFGICCISAVLECNLAFIFHCFFA